MSECTRPIGESILIRRRIHDGAALVTGLGSAVKFSVQRLSDLKFWDGNSWETAYTALDASEPHAAGGGAANNHNKGVYQYALDAAAAAVADIIEWASVYSPSAGIEYVESGKFRLVKDESDVAAELHLVKQAIMGDGDVENVGGEHRVFDEDGETVLATARFAETIAVTAANWTNATRYIVKVGAFADYLWKTGDIFTLTAGTGATAAQYTITSKVDDDTIELATDINGAGGNIADNSIAGVIRTGRAIRRVTE